MRLNKTQEISRIRLFLLQAEQIDQTEQQQSCMRGFDSEHHRLMAFTARLSISQIYEHQLLMTNGNRTSCSVT